MAGKGGIEGSTLRTSRAILEELAPLLVVGNDGKWIVLKGPRWDMLAAEIKRRTRRMERRRTA